MALDRYRCFNLCGFNQLNLLKEAKMEWGQKHTIVTVVVVVLLVISLMLFN